MSEVVPRREEQPSAVTHDSRDLATRSATLVVIPTYNEVDNIEEVLHRTRRALPAADVLVIDDNSPDGTAEVAASIGRSVGGVRVVQRPEKAGLGTAYVSGFREAIDHGYRAVVEMDADHSHDPAVLPTMVERVATGADLVIGSRYVPGGTIPRWRWHRRALSQAGNRYASFLLNLPVADATSGFRVYSTAMLERMGIDDVSSSGYGFQIEMTYRAVCAGARITEVPIAFVDRVAGESKMSAAVITEAFGLVTRWGIARSRSRASRRGAGARPPTLRRSRR